MTNPVVGLFENVCYCFVLLYSPRHRHFMRLLRNDGKRLKSSLSSSLSVEVIKNLLGRVEDIDSRQRRGQFDIVE